MHEWNIKYYTNSIIFFLLTGISSSHQIIQYIKVSKSSGCGGHFPALLQHYGEGLGAIFLPLNNLRLEVPQIAVLSLSTLKQMRTTMELTRLWIFTSSMHNCGVDSLQSLFNPNKVAWVKTELELVLKSPCLIQG